MLKSGNIRIFFHSGEKETAERIAAVCERTVPLARDAWGLEAPADCRIFIMTSMREFVFRSAPASWRILLALGLPLWYFRARKTWKFSAGWTIRYGRRIVIGVKPPEALARSDRRMGTRVFVEEQDPGVSVGWTACHELVHACAARLRLPAWLNEGIAMATVDGFAEKPTVRDDTLSFLVHSEAGREPATYGEFSRLEEETLIRQFVRGYWIVRYLEENAPGLLRNLFTERKTGREIVQEISSVLGMKQGSFQEEIDGLTVRHFSQKKP